MDMQNIYIHIKGERYTFTTSNLVILGGSRNISFENNYKGGNH